YAVSKIKKLQRRDYFRLGITVPLKISYSVDGTDIKKETYTIDISGGGLKIGCDSRFDKGTGLEIQIEIPNLNDKKLKGRVIRCRPSLKNNKVYEIGIEFQDLKPN
ncbi:MAG TPA: hypothetical protein DD426_04750, partial [Clostridiaceae bacterium]|nr:hypothetical protein [Clostridiaceae bacterium]